MPVPKIITPRLILREIKGRDTFGFMELLSDKGTMELIGGFRSSNDLEHKDIVGQINKEFEKGFLLFWVITLVENSEFIGFIKLMSYNSYYFDISYAGIQEQNKNPQVLKKIDRSGWEIEYALLKDYRGKGLMSEAIEFVINYCDIENISPLYARVNNISNTATIKVLKNVGFIKFLSAITQIGESGEVYKRE